MRTTNVKDRILSIAKEVGVEEQVASEIAQKCYDDIAMWRPYGGATSFADIDSSQMASEYASKVDQETYALRAIVENITASDELDSADAKAAAIQQAANDYRSRVNAIQLSPANKSILERTLKKIFGSKEEEEVIQSNYGIKIYKDKQGRDRWLSHSSNAFEDLDKELFTTKALEEAVEYADKTGERGPLMFFHIPGTEVGQTDFQAVAGRFLVESGTFLDTPLGAKALEYLKGSDDEHQVSIGFEFKAGDEEDGIYDWLRVRERSFLPFGTAANPWTDFKLIGEKEMDARHLEALEKVFGKDLASGIVASAEERSKELEANVAFKAKKPADDDEDEEDPKKMPYKKEGEETVEVVEATPAFGTEQITALATLLTDLSTQVTALSSLKEVVVGIQEEVKALKATDDEKIASQMSPRFNPPLLASMRPTDDPRNVLDQKALDDIKGALGGDKEPEESPAQQYANDLLALLGKRAG